MQIANSKATAKVAAVATALAMASSMLSFAPAVHAATTCDTGAASLTIGATGMYVTNLQNALIGAGYSIPAGATGYFGTQTQGAVAAWQAASGVAPAAGYFGPISRAAFNLSCDGSTSTGGTSTVAGCMAGDLFSRTTGASCSAGAVVPGCVAGALFSSTTGASCASGTGSTSTGPLSGGAGDITVTAESTYSSENVTQGEEDAPVLAFNVEADSDSDVSISAVKVEFVESGSTSSEDLDDYAESVSIWLDGKKVGEADVDEFSESSDVWTKSIKLTGAIVRADDDMDFVVAVTALNNLDSGDIDSDAWTVDVLNVRFEDGDGVVTTEDTDGDSLEKTLYFYDLSTSGDLEAKITENSDSPDATSVEIDDTSDTNDVLLLAVNFKATGSDMTVDQLKFEITPTGANANEIVKKYKLLLDGDEIDSISATSIATGVTGSITFDDLEDDFAVDEGDTVVFKLLADINDAEGDFGSGDSILASITSTNFAVGSSTVEDSEGDEVANGDRSGSVTGETQTFYTDGIGVTLDSVKAESFTVDGEDNDRAELTIAFKVKAFGADAYIPSFMTPTTNGTNATTGTGSSSTTPTTASGVAFHVQSSDTDLTIARLGGSTLTSTAEEKTNSFKVVEGQTETFTLKVLVNNAATSLLDSASVRTLLTGINFATTDTATGSFVYTADLADTFKTGYATIAD